MVRKIKSCIFISGNGSNMLSIIKASREYNFPIKIELIISNNLKAKGLVYAKKYSIPYRYITSKDIMKFERDCLFLLKRKKIKFICLAGFMKKLSKSFIINFGFKIINIHPSLLPKYKGLNTFKRLLNSGEKYAGSTVHFVTEKLDSGLIILKKKVLIEKNETENTLKQKVLNQEHKLYPQSIINVFK